MMGYQLTEGGRPLEFKVWCKTLADKPSQNRKWFSFGKGPTPEAAAKQVVDYQTSQGRRTEVLSVWKQDANGEWQQVSCDLASLAQSGASGPRGSRRPAG